MHGYLWLGCRPDQHLGRDGGDDLPLEPATRLEKINDLLGKTTNDGKDGATAERLAAGVCGSDQWAHIDGRFRCNLAGTPPLRPRGVQLVARAFLDKGYSTNYASSWFYAVGLPS